MSRAAFTAGSEPPPVLTRAYMVNPFSLESVGPLSKNSLNIVSWPNGWGPTYTHCGSPGKVSHNGAPAPPCQKPGVQPSMGMVKEWSSLSVTLLGNPFG